MCRVEVDGVDEILSYTDINQQTPLQVAVEAGNIENVKVEYLNIENYLFSQYGMVKIENLKSELLSIFHRKCYSWIYLLLFFILMNRVNRVVQNILEKGDNISAALLYASPL